MLNPLHSPRLYAGMMTLLGADAGMEIFVRQFLRPRPGERILDVGCGPGRLIPHLQAVDYWGIDVDAASIRWARQRFPAARFVQTDPCSEDPGFQEWGFDVALACGLLHHLPDSQVTRLLAFCESRLRRGGRLITLDCVRETNQHPISKLLVSADRGRFARTGAAYLTLAHDLFPCAALTIRHDLLKVPYSHAILECVKR